MRRFFPMLACAAATAACDPAWSVQGHVAGPGGVAVRGATAVLRCAGQADRTARTDLDGVFEIGGTGAGPSLQCTVKVTAPGFVPASLRLDDGCDDEPEGSDSCVVAVLAARLELR